MSIIFHHLILHFTYNVVLTSNNEFGHRLIIGKRAALVHQPETYLKLYRINKFSEEPYGTIKPTTTSDPKVYSPI